MAITKTTIKLVFRIRDNGIRQKFPFYKIFYRFLRETLFFRNKGKRSHNQGQNGLDNHLDWHP